MKPIIKNRWVKSYIKDGGKDGSIPKEHLDAVRERAARRKPSLTKEDFNSKLVQQIKEDMVNEDLDEHFEKEESSLTGGFIEHFASVLKTGSKDAS